MSDYNATREEISKFIWSDNFTVRANPNKTLVILSDSADGYLFKSQNLKHVLMEKDLVALEDTPGGLMLNKLLSSNKITNVDRHSIVDQAIAKQISFAQGNLTVLFGKNADVQSFERYHLPQILRNDQLTSVNHIEARLLRIRHENDFSRNKLDSLERITLVLQGKEDIPFMLGKGESFNPEKDKIRAIEQAIDLVGGAELREAINNRNIKQISLEGIRLRHEMFERKTDLITFRNAPLTRVKVFLERRKVHSEISKREKDTDEAERKLINVQSYLRSNEGIDKIYNEADVILDRKRNHLKIDEVSKKRVIDTEIRNYIDNRRRMPQPSNAYAQSRWQGPDRPKPHRKGPKL